MVTNISKLEAKFVTKEKFLSDSMHPVLWDLSETIRGENL